MAVMASVVSEVQRATLEALCDEEQQRETHDRGARRIQRTPASPPTGMSEAPSTRRASEADATVQPDTNQALSLGVDRQMGSGQTHRLRQLLASPRDEKHC